VGRWALNGTQGSQQISGVIEFNPDASYYGGPVGTDLSPSYAYDGSYAVSGSTFHLIFSCGDGCNGEGFFDMQFQSACATAILNETITACTGTRLTLAGTVVLTRQ
jgi:hypothetical protein